MKITTFGLSLIVILLPLHSHSQTTLGELLDSKATKFTHEQMLKATLGRKIVTTTPQGLPLEIAYDNAGRATGLVQSPRGPIQLAGEWTVESDGKLCTRLSNNPPRCQYAFTLDGAIFISTSDADRSAPVQKVR